MERVVTHGKVEKTMGDHGCVGHGGYSWCEALNECVRPWETDCPDTLEIDAPTPTHNVTSVPTTVPIPETHHDKDEEPPVGTYDGAIVIVEVSDLCHG